MSQFVLLAFQIPHKAGMQNFLIYQIFMEKKIKLQIFSMQLKMTINVIGNITESPRTFYVLPDISLLTLCLILRYLASKHPKNFMMFAI